MSRNILLQSELEFQQLMESADLVFEDLCEHRGKPDPEKLAARLASRERGKIRRKNAEERRRELELHRRNRERYRRMRDAELRKEENEKRWRKKLHQLEARRSDDSEQSQARSQKHQKKAADRLVLDTKQQRAQYSQILISMEDNAPTQNAQKVGLNTATSIKKYDQDLVRQFQNFQQQQLSDAQLQKYKDKELDDYDDYLDEIYDRQQKELKTKEEKKWLKKNIKNAGTRGKKIISNIFDLMGFKDVYDDVVTAGKFILGSN